MNWYRPVRSGALVTLAIGVVAGLVLPWLGPVAGAVAGGLVTGVRSADRWRLPNGFVAALLGSVVPEPGPRSPFSRCSRYWVRSRRGS